MKRLSPAEAWLLLAAVRSTGRRRRQHSVYQFDHRHFTGYLIYSYAARMSAAVYHVQATAQQDDTRHFGDSPDA